MIRVGRRLALLWTLAVGLEAPVSAIQTPSPETYSNLWEDFRGILLASDSLEEAIDETWDPSERARFADFQREGVGKGLYPFVYRLAVDLDKALHEAGSAPVAAELKTVKSIAEETARRLAAEVLDVGAAQSRVGYVKVRDACLLPLIQKGLPALESIGASIRVAIEQRDRRELDDLVSRLPSEKQRELRRLQAEADELLRKEDYAGAAAKLDRVFDRLRDHFAQAGEGNQLYRLKGARHGFRRTLPELAGETPLLLRRHASRPGERREASSGLFGPAREVRIESQAQALQSLGGGKEAFSEERFRQAHESLSRSRRHGRELKGRGSDKATNKSRIEWAQSLRDRLRGELALLLKNSPLTAEQKRWVEMKLGRKIDEWLEQFQRLVLAEARSQDDRDTLAHYRALFDLLKPGSADDERRKLAVVEVELGELLEAADRAIARVHAEWAVAHMAAALKDPSRAEEARRRIEEAFNRLPKDVREKLEADLARVRELAAQGRDAEAAALLDRIFDGLALQVEDSPEAVGYLRLTRDEVRKRAKEGEAGEFLRGLWVPSSSRGQAEGWGFADELELSFYRLFGKASGSAWAEKWSRLKALEKEARSHPDRSESGYMTIADPSGEPRYGYFVRLKDGRSYFDSGDGFTVTVYRDASGRLVEVVADSRTGTLVRRVDGVEQYAQRRSADGGLEGTLNGRRFRAGPKEKAILEQDEKGDVQTVLIADSVDEESGAPRSIREILDSEGRRGGKREAQLYAIRKLASGLGAAAVVETEVISPIDNKTRRGLLIAFKDGRTEFHSGDGLVIITKIVNGTRIEFARDAALETAVQRVNGEETFRLAGPAEGPLTGNFGKWDWIGFSIPKGQGYGISVDTRSVAGLVLSVAIGTIDFGLQVAGPGRERLFAYKPHGHAYVVKFMELPDGTWGLVFDPELLKGASGASAREKLLGMVPEKLLDAGARARLERFLTIMRAPVTPDGGEPWEVESLVVRPPDGLMMQVKNLDERLKAELGERAYFVGELRSAGQKFSMYVLNANQQPLYRHVYDLEKLTCSTWALKDGKWSWREDLEFKGTSGWVQTRFHREGATERLGKEFAELSEKLHLKDILGIPQSVVHFGVSTIYGVAAKVSGSWEARFTACMTSEQARVMEWLRGSGPQACEGAYTRCSQSLHAFLVREKGRQGQADYESFLKAMDGFARKCRQDAYGTELNRILGRSDEKRHPITEQERALAACAWWGLRNAPEIYMKNARARWNSGQRWSAALDYAAGGAMIGGQAYAEGLMFGSMTSVLRAGLPVRWAGTAARAEGVFFTSLMAPDLQISGVKLMNAAFGEGDKAEAFDEFYSKFAGVAPFLVGHGGTRRGREPETRTQERPTSKDKPKEAEKPKTTSDRTSERGKGSSGQGRGDAGRRTPEQELADRIAEDQKRLEEAERTLDNKSFSESGEALRKLESHLRESKGKLSPEAYERVRVSYEKLARRHRALNQRHWLLEAFGLMEALNEGNVTREGLRKPKEILDRMRTPEPDNKGLYDILRSGVETFERALSKREALEGLKKEREKEGYTREQIELALRDWQRSTGKRAWEISPEEFRGESFRRQYLERAKVLEKIDKGSMKDADTAEIMRRLKEIEDGWTGGKKDAPHPLKQHGPDSPDTLHKDRLNTEENVKRNQERKREGKPQLELKDHSMKFPDPEAMARAVRQAWAELRRLVETDPAFRERVYDALSGEGGARSVSFDFFFALEGELGWTTTPGKKRPQKVARTWGVHVEFRFKPDGSPYIHTIHPSDRPYQSERGARR